MGSSRRTSWPKFSGDDLPPSLRPHYRTFVATTRQSAPLRCIGTFGLAVGAACAFSLGIAGQVLTFRTKAWSSFAPPTRRMPLGRYQDILRADPGGSANPRFRHRLSKFRRFCSGSLALASLDHACRDHRPGFSATLTTMAFGHSSLRWLGIGDLITEPEGPPSSPVQLRNAVWTGDARDARHRLPVRGTAKDRRLSRVDATRPPDHLDGDFFAWNGLRSCRLGENSSS